MKIMNFIFILAPALSIPFFLVSLLSYKISSVLVSMYSGCLLAQVFPNSVPKNFSLTKNKKAKFLIFISVIGIFMVMAVAEHLN